MEKKHLTFLKNFIWLSGCTDLSVIRKQTFPPLNCKEWSFLLPSENPEQILKHKNKERVPSSERTDLKFWPICLRVPDGAESAPDMGSSFLKGLI